MPNHWGFKGVGKRAAGVLQHQSPQPPSQELKFKSLVRELTHIYDVTISLRHPPQKKTKDDNPNIALIIKNTLYVFFWMGGIS